MHFCSLTPDSPVPRMPASDIIIRGAREHNLRNVDLTLPRGELVVMSGVSGSGKSSLAFDTLYAEGQRRYVESLSTYARQFLGQMPKPEVDAISGLAPSISIQQKATSRNPRSTVGTITEIYDYLRVLYARVGHGHCEKCGKPITAQSVDQILESINTLPEGTKFQILAPIVQNQKGEFRDLFADLLKQGFVRRACGWRDRQPDRRPGSQEALQAYDRSRRRPIDRRQGTPHADGRGDRVGHSFKRRHSPRGASRRTGFPARAGFEGERHRSRRDDRSTTLLREVRLCRVWHLVRTSLAATLQFQQPARDVRRLHRSGTTARVSARTTIG